MRPLLRALVVFVAGCSGAPAPGADGAQATGSVEHTEVEIASVVPGRIDRIAVGEGDSVRAGDTLVVIAQSGLREEIAARRARVAAAEARARDLEAGARPADLARAEAEVRAAEADADRTQRDAARLASLPAGDVSPLQLDGARSAARVAAARRDAAQQAMQSLRDGTRPGQIAAARAEVSAARAAVDAAIHSASDLVLVAPVSGVVTSRHAERGEVMAAGASILTVGDVGHPYVRVFVGQEWLSRIHVGDTVSATLDAFSDRPFVGRVAAVSTRAEFTPRVALTREERADLLFGVRVELVDQGQMLKAGLPVTVRFRARAGR